MLTPEEQRLYNEQIMKINTQVIKLNVGGTSFYSSYGTLRSSPFLKQLISNYTESLLDKEIFIDRSAQLFTHIMQYLRDSTIYVNDNLEALKNEAEYFQLNDLVVKLDNLIKDPISERNRVYELLDFNELKNISTVTPQNGTTQAIHEIYDIISIVSYVGFDSTCSSHGPSNAYCNANCNVSLLNHKPYEKLLVRKK